MKTMIRLCALMAAGVLALGLAACNGDETSSSSSSAGTTSGGAKATVEITAPATTEPAEAYEPAWPEPDFTGSEITVCIDWSPSSSWVQRWEEAFHHYFPDVTVAYKQAQPSAKAARLAVWKNAGQSPDVMYIKPEESWPTLINQSLVQAIDEYIDVDTDFWKTANDIMENLKIGGKQYTLVTDAYRYGSILYNPDVFKNAGLEDPLKLLYEDKWTQSTFENYIKRLTKIDTQDASKSNYGAHLRYAEPFLATIGKDLISYENDAWVSNLNDPDVVSQIEFLKRIGTTGENYITPESYDETQLRTMTVNGQVAMYVTAESGGTEFPEEFKSGKMRAVPFPRYKEDGEYYLAGVVDGFFIPEGAKNPAGGAAYAMAVRAMDVLDLKLGEGDDSYTEEFYQMQDYIDSVAVYVPMQFRRLAGKVEYYNIYGPTLKGGEAYSAVVQEWEPIVLAELAKQN